ncbi:MAG: Rpn family recombination-promoting nuclease/putative transposase [Candidatus Electrothrix sp. GW3-4]|uniref:Rpn family recombination-promoting nuclease/putative transposase n=1 Tax=Candidatus Electrothrix sp. GW3-4 TaxID=3126740 RepID=UPI0030D57BFA
MPQRKLISFDWAMKKLLRSKANFEILEGFLSELLMEDITILKLLESDSNKHDACDKFNQVGLKVKNDKEKILIIEIQYEREFDYLQRILFGTSKIVSEHLHESAPYAKVAKVISITLLSFDLGHGDDYVYHGTTSFRGLHSQDLLELSSEQRELYGRSTIHALIPEHYLIKIKKFDNVIKGTLDEWIYFFKNREIRDNFQAKGIKRAKQELDVARLSDEEYRTYDRYQDHLHYQESMVEFSYTFGVMKGIKQGMRKGEEQKAVEITRKLIEQGGLDDKNISEMTGLPEEEVGKWRRQ